MLYSCTHYDNGGRQRVNSCLSLDCWLMQAEDIGRNKGRLKIIAARANSSYFAAVRILFIYKYVKSTKIPCSDNAFVNESFLSLSAPLIRAAAGTQVPDGYPGNKLPG